MCTAIVGGKTLNTVSILFIIETLTVTSLPLFPTLVITNKLVFFICKVLNCHIGLKQGC